MLLHQFSKAASIKRLRLWRNALPTSAMPATGVGVTIAQNNLARLTGARCHLLLGCVAALLLVLLAATPTAINAQSPNELHTAIFRGNTDTVRLLLEQGADPDAKNKPGSTPLHRAIFYEATEIVRLLLQHGADPDAKSNGDTPLHAAIFYERTEIVELLLEHGADPDGENNRGSTPLNRAIFYEATEIARLLLQHGADPNAKSNGNTPLHAAIFRERTEIVELLLEHGADPDAKSDGDTPLHAAIFRNRTEIAKLLLEHGADPNAKSNGDTPLHAAIFRNRTEIAKLLREYGATTEAKSDGDAPTSEPDGPPEDNQSQTSCAVASLDSPGNGDITLNRQQWDSGCASVNRSGSYAQFYTFNVGETTEVSIVLTSERDTYLYLLAGDSPSGEIIESNDDGVDGSNSRIVRRLEPGAYTIEATTYSPEATGSFRLHITTPEPDATTPEPDAATPEPDATTPEPDAATSEPDAATPEPDAAAPEPTPTVRDLSKPSMKVIDRTDRALTLEWHTVPGASTYELRRRASSESNYELVSSVIADTQHTDTGLNPDTDYYYVLKACNTAGCSAQSDVTGGITEADGAFPIPDKPTGVRARKVAISLNHDWAEVAWNRVPGATYYKVYQEDQKDKPDAEVSAPRTIYTDSNPDTATFFVTYYVATGYLVSACNKSGCSDFSAIAWGRTTSWEYAETAPPTGTANCVVEPLDSLVEAMPIVRDNQWDSGCESMNRLGSYAQFYSFQVGETTEASISLASSRDPYLYLLAGDSPSGEVIESNDDGEVGSNNSRIVRTLEPGTYTIEATTRSPESVGIFTLTVTAASNPSQSPTPQSPTPQSPTPQSPTPQSPTPQSPTPQSPTPQSPTPQSPTPQPMPPFPTPWFPTPQPMPPFPTPWFPTHQFPTPQPMPPFPTPWIPTHQFPTPQPMPPFPTPWIPTP